MSESWVVHSMNSHSWASLKHIETETEVTEIVQLVNFENQSFDDLFIKFGDKSRIKETVSSLMPFLKSHFTDYVADAATHKYLEHQKEVASSWLVNQNFHFDHSMRKGLNAEEHLSVMSNLRNRMTDDRIQKVVENLQRDPELQQDRLENPYQTCLLIHTISDSCGRTRNRQKGVVFYRSDNKTFDSVVAVASQRSSLDPFWQKPWVTAAATLVGVAGIAGVAGPAVVGAPIAYAMAGAGGVGGGMMLIKGHCDKQRDDEVHDKNMLDTYFAHVFGSSKSMMFNLKL